VNPNNTFAPAKTFGKQHVLNHAPRNLEEERLALRYLDKWAPDLVGVILGGVL
jgi:pyoverdine/dityrosine biosynthesis protein Dit1